MNNIEISFTTILDYLANTGVGLSATISLISLLIYAVLIFLQVREWVTIRDFLKKYRGIVLLFLTISFLSLIPVTYYLFNRYLGINDENLRNFATVSGRLGTLAQALSLVFIYFYRNKGDK